MIRVNLIELKYKYRNEEAAGRLISELKGLQPDGEVTFIKKDLTLLKSVDEVCEEIKAKEKKLNLLFMSQGTLSLKGRDGEPTPDFPFPFSHQIPH